MISKIMLSIDLSTTCTGLSIFKLDTKELISHRYMKPSTKGLSKLKYPVKQLIKMLAFAADLSSYVDEVNPDIIVIEEIAGSRQRMGQKTLDGMHWLLLLSIKRHVEKVIYYDVTGKNGWRFHLGLKLSDADKINNKESKKINKKLEKGTSKLPIIGPKHLAARYVNKYYNMNLDVDLNTYDADIADSIAMGSAFLKFRCTL